MSGILSRRSLLVGAGFATAYGSLAARLLSVAEAEEAAQPKAAGSTLCMNMIFPNEAKAKIDEKRYIEKHLPLLRKIYGDSVERIEFRTSQSPSPGMPATSVRATAHIWIKDVQGFSKALQENNQAINADLDATAKGPRVVQIDKLVTSHGDPLADVKVGHQVMTVYYPAGEGKTWSDDYFVNTHIPKLLASYGLSVVRRLDGSLGQDQGASKARYRATVQLYVRDRSAYDAAVQSSLSDLIEDAKKFTNILPELNEFRVQAIG